MNKVNVSEKKKANDDHLDLNSVSSFLKLTCNGAKAGDLDQSLLFVGP